MNRFLYAIVVLTATSAIFAQPRGRYVEIGSIASDDATQAACADEKFVYAVSNTRVVKYDRKSGKQLAISTGEASHLNHAFVDARGRIFLAHSNYPKKPTECDIRLLDPETMKLTVFHTFKEPPGSLTWATPGERLGDWMCCFAHYGDDNAKTVLVSYDSEWKELGRWSLPAKLVADLGKNSLSSGIFVRKDTIYATGHDKKVVYLLEIPKEGREVVWRTTYESPFPGQGIALDPKTLCLVGIDRMKRKVIFTDFRD